MDFFAKRLKLLRQQHNLTQTQLAELLGITQDRISNFETMRSQPDIDTLRAIARFFKVSIDYLIGRTN